MLVAVYQEFIAGTTCCSGRPDRWQTLGLVSLGAAQLLSSMRREGQDALPETFISLLETSSEFAKKRRSIDRYLTTKQLIAETVIRHVCGVSQPTRNLTTVPSTIISESRALNGL